MKILKINKKLSLSNDRRPLLVAEISANHAGSKKSFLKHILEAKKSGADIVKIQTYEPEDITLKQFTNKFKIKNGTWKNKYLWNLYSKAQTPHAWHGDAFKLAKKKNITLFSSPFSERSVLFLEKFKVPIYKIASLEITDLNLIKCIAKKNKPIILSTGISNYKEIKMAIDVIKKFHNKIILLHCVSGYATPINEINLSRIKLLKEKFKINFVGLSDHTSSYEACLGSIFFGACLIEKHFSLNKKTLDGEFSLGPKDFLTLSKKIKDFHEMKGNEKFQINNSEKETLKLRRSIFVIKDINKNEKFSKNNIKCLRPFIGLNSNLYNSIIGKKSNYNIKTNTALKKWMLK